MLIDDDEVSNYINSELIEDLQLARELTVCENGRIAMDALQKIASTPPPRQDSMPKLILLDLNMPEMNGFAFLEAYQKLPNDMKADVIIVLLTTSLQESDIEKINAVHKSEIVFLEKPLTVQALNDVTNQYFK